MAVSRVQLSSIKQGFPKYRSMLAGNAAYDPAATWLIQRVTATGGSASISFTSIPQSYVSLQIRGGNLQSENGTTGSYGFNMQFNSDTGANYAVHLLYGDGATASASGVTAQSSMTVGRYSRNSESAKGAAIIDIHNYASTTQNKTSRSFSGLDLNGAGLIYGGTSGLWLNTAAITSITLIGNGNWKSGTTFALYGMVG